MANARHVWTLANALSRGGLPVAILTEERASAGLDSAVEQIVFRPQTPGPLRRLSRARKIRETLSRKCPDILYVIDSWSLPEFMLATGGRFRWGNCRIVYHTYDWLEPGLVNPLHILLERTMCRRADLVVNTDSARARLQQTLYRLTTTPLAIQNSPALSDTPPPVPDLVWRESMVGPDPDRRKRLLIYPTVISNADSAQRMAFELIQGFGELLKRGNSECGELETGGGNLPPPPSTRNEEPRTNNASTPTRPYSSTPTLPPEYHLVLFAAPGPETDRCRAEAAKIAGSQKSEVSSKKSERPNPPLPASAPKIEESERPSPEAHIPLPASHVLPPTLPSPPNNQQPTTNNLPERIHFLFPVPYARLLPMLAASDLGFVFYDHSQSSGYFMANADKLSVMAACGLPCVASDQPNLKAVVGQHGLGKCCDPHNPGSLAGAILDLAAPRRRLDDLKAHVRSVFGDHLAFEHSASPLVTALKSLAEGTP